jgi:ferrochelatase
MYSLIGGKSPILDITTAQARALEDALNSSLVTRDSLLSFKVYIGMRYWHPFIEDTVRQMYGDGIRTGVALSLYPHYSLATTGSAISRFMDVIKQYPMEFSTVSSWFDHPMYIDALVDVIKKGMESFHSSLVTRHSSFEDIHVLFSAHSLPMSIAESGDPYVYHIRGTIEEVVKRIDIRWHLSYQSKSGPVRWLGPSTDEKIKELARSGAKNILIVPVSFVSDHIETLYEIDILYKALADGLGIKLVRAESLNANPLFIKALTDIVINNINEPGWLKGNG